MSNFLFLTKLGVMQLLLVSLPFMPAFTLTIMLIAEFLYLYTLLSNYVKYKYLKSMVVFIPLIVRSIFFVAIEMGLLITFLSLHKRTIALGDSSQRVIMLIIVLATFIEYLFLLMNIGYLIFRAINDCYRKSKDPKFKLEAEYERQFLKYKKDRPECSD